MKALEAELEAGKLAIEQMKYDLQAGEPYYIEELDYDPEQAHGIADASCPDEEMEHL